LHIRRRGWGRERDGKGEGEKWEGEREGREGNGKENGEGRQVKARERYRKVGKVPPAPQNAILEYGRPLKQAIPITLYVLTYKTLHSVFSKQCKNIFIITYVYYPFC